MLEKGSSLSSSLLDSPVGKGGRNVEGGEGVSDAAWVAFEGVLVVFAVVKWLVDGVVGGDIDAEEVRE